MTKRLAVILILVSLSGCQSMKGAAPSNISSASSSVAPTAVTTVECIQEKGDTVKDVEGSNCDSEGDEIAVKTSFLLGNIFLMFLTALSG